MASASSSSSSSSSSHADKINDAPKVPVSKHASKGYKKKGTKGPSTTGPTTAVQREIVRKSRFANALYDLEMSGIIRCSESSKHGETLTVTNKITVWLGG